MQAMSVKQVEQLMELVLTGLEVQETVIHPHTGDMTVRVQAAARGNKSTAAIIGQDGEIGYAVDSRLVEQARHRLLGKFKAGEIGTEDVVRGLERLSCGR